MTDEPSEAPATDGPPSLPEIPAWEVDGLEQLEAGVLPEAAPVPPPPATASSPVKEVKDEAPPPLVRIVEAMLFVGGAPLTAARACEAIRGLTPEDFQQAVDALNRSYRAQARPYQLQMQDHGYVLALRPRFAGVRDKLYGGVREARLSPTAVDVLALVAYRQPATRQEIDSLRGGDSGGVLRQLVRYGLVALQRGEGADREIRYVTTQRFLDLFHLRSLEDLPQTQDLQRL